MLEQVFVVALALLLIILGTWYVTAEHYEDLMRDIVKYQRELEARNQQLEAERRELDKGLSRLDHQLEQYSDVLEGDAPELEVML